MLYTKGGIKFKYEGLSRNQEAAVKAVKKRIDAVEGATKRIEFLQWCIRNKITPRSRVIKITLDFKDKKVEKARMQLERVILQADIGKKKGEITKYKEDIGVKIDFLREELCKEKEEEVINILCGYKNWRRDFEKHDLERLKVKMEKGNFRKVKKCKYTKVYKVGTVDLSTDEEAFLNLGKSFGVMKEEGRSELVCDLEEVLRRDKDLKEQEKEEIRKEMSNIIQKDIFPRSNLNVEESRGLKSLKNREDVIVMRADKGGSMVVMKKTWYQGQIEELAKGNYIKLEEEHMEEFLKERKSWFSKMQKEKCWTMKERGRARDRVGRCPVMKGFPKIHKKEIVLRPVVNGKEDFKLEIGIFLKEFLGKLIGDKKGGIRDSFEAVKVFEEKVQKGGLLFSFDIKAMFPSMRQGFILERVRECMKFSNSNQWWILDMLKWYLENGFCDIGGTQYRITEGLPIGDCISPILAEIGMVQWVNMVLQIGGENLSFFMHYVDDCLGQWMGSEENLELFKDAVERKEWGIEIDLVKEEKGKIQFLDIEFIKDKEGNWERKWFQKDCLSGTFCHQRSAVGESTKRNMIIGMFERVKKISTGKWIEEGYHRLSEQLKGCGYKSGYIKRLKEDVIAGRKRMDRKPSKSKEGMGYVGIGYFGKVSERIKNALNKKGYKVYFKNGGKLEFKVRGKSSKSDKISEMKGVVYKIKCKDCNDVYIGETGRMLGTRIKDHVRYMKYQDEKSAVYQHSKKEGHDIDLDNVEVLDQECREIGRRFLEGLEIEKHENFNQMDGMSMSKMWGKKCEDEFKKVFWKKKSLKKQTDGAT